MSKIDRYSGNVQAFGSQAQGTERTVFGDTTQSDTLDANITTDFLRGWGIVGVNENPTKQDFNGLAFTLSQLIAYLHQRGIPEWNASQEYFEGSVVTTLAGVYRLLAGGDGSVDPDADDGTNWEKAPTRSEIDQRTIYVGSVAELEALSLPVGTNVYLTQDGRAGEFVVKSGTPPSDPLNGIYILLANGNHAMRIYDGLTDSGGVNPSWWGAVGDGTGNQSQAWQAALDNAKLTGARIAPSPGRYRLESGLVYDTSGDGIAQGPKITADGFIETVLVNAVASGAPTIRLTSGTSFSDFMYNTCIEGIGFEGDASGADSHGIEYQGCWHTSFKNLRFTDLNGSGLRCLNTSADGDSSADVYIENIRATGCAGPAFNSNGGTGGVSLHTLDTLYAVNCGGSDGMVTIDGAVHFQIRQITTAGASAAAGFVPDLKGIRIKSTSITSRLVSIYGGEIGNSLQKGIVVDKAQGLKLGLFRFAKRAGETTFTTGIEFSDGTAGSINGVTIDPVGLQIDTATPAFTFAYLGTAMANDFQVSRPIRTAFAPGNTLYSFGAGIEDKGGYIESSDGDILLPKRNVIDKISKSTTGTFDLDLISGPTKRIVVSATGSHTINLPPGAAEGYEMEVVIWNTSGGSISVTLGNVIGSTYTDPASPNVTSAAFRYDGSSAAWRQIGAWS